MFFVDYPLAISHSGKPPMLEDGKSWNEMGHGVHSKLWSDQRLVINKLSCLSYHKTKKAGHHIVWYVAKVTKKNMFHAFFSWWNPYESPWNLQVAGAHRVVTVELHASQIQVPTWDGWVGLVPGLLGENMRTLFFWPWMSWNQQKGVNVGRSHGMVNLLISGALTPTTCWFWLVITS